MNITHDLHMHTHLSYCGKDEATVENYLAQAAALGLTRLGFTDHVWDSAVEGMPHWYRQTDVQDAAHVLQTRPVLEQYRGCGVDLLMGCEAEYDYAHRSVALTEAAAEQFDFIIASTTHTHNTMPKAFYHPPRRHAEFILQAWEDMLAAPVSRYFTAMAHPFHAVCCPYGHEAVMAQITDDELRRLFDRTAARGIAVEINIKCLVGHLEQFAADLERQPHLRLFRIAKECGCLFTFGTDCHRPDAQRMIRFAPRVAQLLGLTEKDLHPLAR